MSAPPPSSCTTTSPAACGDNDEPAFTRAEDEASYWKKKAKDAQREAQEARDELDEFQEGSRELEAELETQLEQSEAKVKEFRSMANRLQMENDQLKDKLEQCQREYHCQVTELQTELSSIKEIRDQLNKYVRELEQQNDDLERAKRSTIASLEDFEARLNVAIERNAFLESELDEKESLKAAVQRMKDETRDLRSELRVLSSHQPSSASRTSSLCSDVVPNNDRPLESNNNMHRKSSSSGVPDSNKLAADCETKSEASNSATASPSNSVKNSPSSQSSNRRSALHNGGQQQPLTPSARISALNIVGDLLRKVGALELKLVSCRNIVKESTNVETPHTEEAPAAMTHASSASSPVRGNGRLPRGSSTPAIKKLVDSS